jgi:hypothetical protein
MATKNKLLTVLSDAEQFALYGLPDFDEEQRLEFLSLSEAQLALACSRSGLHAQVHCSLSKLAVSGSFSRSRLVAAKGHEENAGMGCKSLIKISRISTSHQARAIQCFSARRSSAVVTSGN